MREIEVPMPKLSMTMEEGELIAWVKQEGDEVRAGDVIAEVNSDKVEMEVESPADGTLVRHTAAEGDVVPVGAPIATSSRLWICASRGPRLRAWRYASMDFSTCPWPARASPCGART